MGICTSNSNSIYYMYVKIELDIRTFERTVIDLLIFFKFGMV